MKRDNHTPIHLAIRESLGLPETQTDDEFYEELQMRKDLVSKPCHELGYCPYGSLSERYCTLPVLRKDAIEHQAYLEQCLADDKCGCGEPFDDEIRARFISMTKDFDPDIYPDEIPKEIDEMVCLVYGRFCPVLFTAEGVTEISDCKWVVTEWD